MADTSKADASVKEMPEELYDTELRMSVNASAPAAPQKSDDHHSHPGSIPCEDGGQVTITYDVKQFKDTYLDEYTREPLPHHLVRAAIRDELDYFNKTVWELSDAKRVLGEEGAKVIRTRWVICNKGGCRGAGYSGKAGGYRAEYIQERRLLREHAAA